MQVNTSWSPHAAARVYNLVQNGFYNNVYFFRVIAGFVNEFGLAPDPKLQAHYCNDNDCSVAALAEGAAVEKDKGPLIGPGNTFGTVAFSLMPTFGNGSVEIYINLGNNSRLDKDGFRPFGVVSGTGMETVEKLYAGYGEMNEPDVCPDPKAKLCKGPTLAKMLAEGNTYLRQSFPKMSQIDRAWIRIE